MRFDKTITNLEVVYDKERNGWILSTNIVDRKMSSRLLFTKISKDYCATSAASALRRLADDIHPLPKPPIRKPRSEVAAFLNWQWGDAHMKNATSSAWHYGKIDTKEFMDWMYGGPPVDKSEEIG